MIKINIQADSRYPIDRKSLRQTLKETLKLHHLDHCEISLSVVGKRKMAQLNQTYRGKEGPTDVLSFAFNETETPPSNPNNPPHLGEIVICYPIAIDYALRRQMLVDRVINELAEHGLLHLLGIHHH